MIENVTFHDHKPQALSLYDAVVAGLSKSDKSIPPKFFYDQRGSELFDRICEQPEYYLPTVERRMLSSLAEEIANLTGTGRVLIEPGAGNAAKVRLLLDALRPSAFVPMDISFDYLKSSARALAVEYPWLPIHAACVDFTHSLPIPREVPNGPRLLFFPGSSLGNFSPSEAGGFLRLVHDTVGSGGMMLIGVDTKKSERVLNAAYNDAAGLTADFNLNLLQRMQQELDTDIDPEVFEHLAFYNDEEGCIEMHLVSTEEQTLRLNGHRFEFKKGETLHTENSYKYSQTEFINLVTENGFNEVRHWVDDDGLFAVYLVAVA
ncbi:MAG: L-histidine N(alpha)-methyltransferase [Candidatus Thiodiazotropha endolucinida]|uniref:Histidine-specific methyltransferase EgtD n=1 Tax=Candidatus Thiodiazotropha endolucinida TaxID=1655433 RepID=A0A7Z1AH35_9GAMM|nr:L-histidine N(alpha)-methyltransferase [Candidatus Thiodiazotropha endolucinida]ODJ89173.1 histidine-specific methyltransferase EgtD [Candidatus Thiodiazotropha endolucinida]